MSSTSTPVRSTSSMDTSSGSCKNFMTLPFRYYPLTMKETPFFQARKSTKPGRYLFLSKRLPFYLLHTNVPTPSLQKREVSVYTQNRSMIDQ
mmetsp:Transcript_10250/g.26858  ORF Transcript_10250/g.26858 Transcript_10250/m.26858 type:complete len:92 (-) Transcript_10250:383-658(-)